MANTETRDALLNYFALRRTTPHNHRLREGPSFEGRYSEGLCFGRRRKHITVAQEIGFFLKSSNRRQK